MRRILFTCLIFILIIFLTGCNNDNKFKLIVKETTWSGWAEEQNYEPQIKTEEYEVVLNKKYVFKSNFNDNFTFTVEEINKDNIVIKTEEPFSDKETEIDLSATKKTFTIYKDNEKRLDTITMDAGAIYYLTLEQSN